MIDVFKHFLHFSSFQKPITVEYILPILHKQAPSFGKYLYFITYKYVIPVIRCFIKFFVCFSPCRNLKFKIASVLSIRF